MSASNFQPVISRRGLLGAAGVATLASLGLTACGGSKTGAGSAASNKPVVVGSKAFTEGEILSEIYALALEDAGIPVTRKFEISGSIIHQSLTEGDIDLYPEYTGTGLLNVLKMPAESDPEQVYKTVKSEYEKQFKLTWLDESSASDGQGLVITTKASKALGITTISQLQEHAGEISFASQGQFDEREDSLPALEKVYGAFNWKSHKVYDEGLKYTVLENDEADVTPAYTTEAQLSKPEFTLLEDDKKVWPPYNVAPVVRDETLKAYPEIEDALNRVSKALDTATLTKLNARVDLDKEDFEDVAADFFDSIA